MAPGLSAYLIAVTNNQSSVRRLILFIRSTLADFRSGSADSRIDLLSLSLAGMRDGVGPVLTLYLVSQLGLNPVELSWVIAAAGVAALLSQTPIGFIYDRIPNKSHLIALGAFIMAVSCYSMSLTRSVPILVTLQMCVGFATCLISVGVPAVCVGFVRDDKLATRLARNEIFAKIGNFSALALTGFLMQKFSLSWVFYIVPILAVPVIWSALRLPSVDVPVSSARPLEPVSFKAALLRSCATKGFLTLTTLGFLFAFANGAMFFIFEQDFMKSTAMNKVGIISASLILTQVTITFAMIFLSRLKNFSAYQIFGFSFVLILLRALLLSVDLGVMSLAPAQILDGMIAAILFTVPMRIVAGIDRENFNVMSGMLGTCVSLGATLSTLFAGFAVQNYGSIATYLIFGSVALLGLMIAVGARLTFTENPQPQFGIPDPALVAV